MFRPGRMRSWLLVLLIGLTACTEGTLSQLTGRDTGEIYLPPTAATSPIPIKAAEPSPQASREPQPAAFQPTPTPLCTNNLRYISDLTIPDGTKVAPGSLVDKRWQVENTGTCNWDHTYRLRLIAGPNFGTPQEGALYPARSGTQPVIQILFNAPSEAGTYHSAWQAISPQGEAFGDPIFVEIIVAPGG